MDRKGTKNAISSRKALRKPTTTQETAMPLDLQARKDRWARFLSPDADPGFLFTVGYKEPERTMPPYPPLWPDKVQERIDTGCAVYEQKREQAEILDDDSIPYAPNTTGTEIFAEALGCRVVRDPDMMPYALYLCRTPAEAARVTVPELSESTLAALFEIADGVRERVGPDAVMKLPDMQSPMDVVCQVWDKAEVFMAMITDPEAVLELEAKTRKLLSDFMHEWSSRYGPDFIAHYPDYYMPYGITLSEDEVGAVNEEMFQTFFKPGLEQLAAEFGAMGLHCCADARHQWPGFRALPNLRVLNHVAPPTRDKEEYILDCHRFYGNSTVQIHQGWRPDPPVEEWPQKYPAGTRVIFQFEVETRDEAMRLCDQFNAQKGQGGGLPHAE
jgi:hypothetical protein